MELKEETSMSSSSSEELSSVIPVVGSSSEERKMCPMPNCKNEVKRGRYCNSCQKRKESLSRTMAQQGIHLNQGRRMRASSSSDSLGEKMKQMTLPPPIPTHPTNRPVGGEWDPSSILIEANKKHRSSEDLIKAGMVKLPHASEILKEDDPMDIYSPSVSRNRSMTLPQESPKLSKMTHNINPYAGMKEEEPKQVMRINSLLSPSSPGMQRQPIAIHTQTTWSQVPVSNPYQTPQQSLSPSEEERIRFNDQHAGEMIQWVDSKLMEISGSDQEATKLLKRYLGSSIGRNRLGFSFEQNNP